MKLIGTPMGEHQVRAAAGCTCEPAFAPAVHILCPVHGLAATLPEIARAVRDREKTLA